jgi:hypothetical protein
VAGAAFITRIASRALAWPVHAAFMTAHEGTGTGLGGGSGEGLTVGKALGLGVATSEGVGVATAVGAEPHVGAEPQPATARRTTRAPTPSLTRD